VRANDDGGPDGSDRRSPQPPRRRHVDEQALGRPTGRSPEHRRRQRQQDQRREPRASCRRPEPRLLSTAG
jgi:hypothetical protein